MGGVDTTGYGLDNNDEIRYADEKGKTASHSRILGRRCTRFGAHSARARRSRSYFGLSTRSHSLAFRYPRHATIRVIVQVRRKRPSSRRAAKLPGRPLEPWDELQMDILRIDTASLSCNDYRLLVADRASNFPFGFPLDTKQALGVARVLTELCLTVGIPRVIRCDRGK